VINLLPGDLGLWILDVSSFTRTTTTMSAATETVTQGAIKRKASVAGFPNGVRPVKRRAAKACQTCRSRKVRCDVVESGPPCNNCRLDQIQCVVSDSRRKRKPRSNAGDEMSSSPISSIAETDFGELKSSSSGNSFELELDHHVPHMLC
jgi:Fungal Zn(2)-Cys(6) binuclear cluster domain